MKDELKLPFWVLLAFSNIKTRKAALILIACSVIFSIYCIPWATLVDNELVTTLFLIDDWTWLAMMLPIVLWYWMSLNWMDKNDAWSLL